MGYYNIGTRKKKKKYIFKTPDGTNGTSQGVNVIHYTINGLPAKLKI